MVTSPADERPTIDPWQFIAVVRGKAEARAWGSSIQDVTLAVENVQASLWASPSDNGSGLVYRRRYDRGSSLPA